MGIPFDVTAMTDGDILLRFDGWGGNTCISSTSTKTKSRIPSSDEFSSGVLEERSIISLSLDFFAPCLRGLDLCSYGQSHGHSAVKR